MVRRRGRKVLGRLLSSLITAVMASAFVSMPMDGMAVTLGNSDAGSNNDSNPNSYPESYILSGEYNNAKGQYSAIVGGFRNYTYSTGKNAVALGGSFNVVSGENSMAGGGYLGAATGRYTTRLGGFDGIVQGMYSTGIGGGSTGDAAYGTLALGQGAVVTNGGVSDKGGNTYISSSIALGYEATASEAGTIALGHDAGDASGWFVSYEYDGDNRIIADTQKITAKDPYTTSYYNRIVKMADGINAHDAVTMGQLTDKTNERAMADASNIGKNLKVADGADIATGLSKLRDGTDDEKEANLNLWGASLGTGTAASGNQQLITGGTLYDEVRPTDGNYVKKNQTAAQNLSALDSQVKTNADGISSLNGRMGSIASDGTYITKAGNISSNLSALDTHMKTNAEAIAVNKNDIAVNAGKISTLESASAGHEDRISKLNTTVESHTTSINELKDTVSKQGNQISQMDGKISENANKISSLERGVANNANAISQNSQAISELKQNGEALKEDNEKIHQELSENSAKISDNTAAIFKNAKDIQDVKTQNEELAQNLDTRLDKDLSNLSDAGKANLQNEVKDAVAKVTGDGRVEDGNTGLITGGTLYREVRPDADGTYISRSNTAGQNLSALDEAVKKTSGLIQDDGKSVHIGKDSEASTIDVKGKDNKGRTITGVVTDASDMTSAANVLYVNEMYQVGRDSIYEDMDRMYSRLDSNINKGVAGASALAALQPMELDGDDKVSFAVGYGHYRNANAAAIGAFYSPNANTRFSFGVSFGNGDSAMNAGLSFKLGKGSSYAGISKADMVRTIQSQAEKIDQLEKENKEMKKAIEEILKKLG